MAKKFMFVCIGILALTIAFLAGAQFGRAEYVDHSATGIVAGVCGNNGGYDGIASVLLDDGEAWDYEYGAWHRHPEWDAPIPVSQVKIWDPSGAFISTSNELWWREGSGDQNWVCAGSPPAGSTSAHPSTWGGIKAQFKD